MANQAIATKGLTFHDVAKLDPDDEPGELDDGTWIPVSRSTFRHGEISGNAYSALRSYAKAHPGWLVSVGDPGARLQRDPDTLLGPDVAVVRAERRPKGRGAEGWLEGAPDLSVEVAGDSQSIAELTRKATRYLAAGGRLVWVLDAAQESVVVFASGKPVRVVGSSEILDGDDLLPGFSCKVSELFE